MNASPSSRRRVFLRGVAPVIGVIAAFGVALTAGATSAAWTDSVTASASASAGTWVSTPTPTAPTSTGPLTPGAGTTLSGTTWDIPSDPTARFCFTTTVSTVSKTPISWSVIADLRQAPFFGSGAMFYTGSTQATSATSGQRATVTGVGGSGTFNPDWNNARIVAGQPLTLTMCNAAPGAPTGADTSWYTTASAPSGAWTRTQACVSTTITSTRNAATDPFFHSWRVKVDLAAATQALKAAGGTPSHTTWTPTTSADGYWFSTSPTDGTKIQESFLVTGGPRGAIKPGQPITLTTCVQGY